MTAQSKATERHTSISLADATTRFVGGLGVAVALYAWGNHNGNLGATAEHNAHVAVIHAQADGHADTTGYRNYSRADADVLPTVQPVAASTQSGTEASTDASNAVTADAVTAAAFEADANQLVTDERYFYTGAAAMLLVALRGIQHLATRAVNARAHHQADNEAQPIHVPTVGSPFVHP